jgi:hypothetical protein
MTAILFDKELDPTPLVTTLIEKTKAGRLKWEPTATENVFIASVGGGTTLRIYLSTTTTLDQYGEPEAVDAPELKLLDEKGKMLWEIHSHQIKGGLWPLFKLAQRVANKLDERMASLMESLRNL